MDFRGAYYSIANFQNLPPYDDNSGENPQPSAYYTCYSSPDINADIEYGFRDLGGSSTERIEPVPPNFGLEGLSADCINNTKENDVYLAEFNYSITLEDLLVWSLRFCNNKSCGDGPAVAEFEYQLRLINDGESIPVEQYAIEELQFSEQENGDIDWGERDELLVNELAPRFHNSGHLTIEAFNISQFENHVRAVCNLNSKSIKKISNAEMLNILGEEILEYRKKKFKQNEFFFDYLKTDIRPGRKMGHLTILKE